MGGASSTLERAQTQTGAASADRGLPTPEALCRALPAPLRAGAAVAAGRASLADLLHGRDRERLAVIVGPCSVHDPAGALDYAQHLSSAAARLADELVIVMRVFVEKPRTHVGWRGFVNDPTLDGRCDVGLGLRSARELLLGIAELGLPCATELLEPCVAPYLRDLIAWGGVGARTSASQVHRQLASEAPHPVGFKNATDGDVDVAVHGMRAASTAQTFLAMGDDGRCVARSARGNPDVHLVLRGGRSGPNHGAAAIAEAARRAAPQGIARPVLVDCSHDNSRRDPRNQAAACREVLAAHGAGTPGVLGVMLESYLEEGRQDAVPGCPLRYGVSITDGCIGWSETDALLEEIAQTVRRSRPAQARAAKRLEELR